MKKVAVSLALIISVNAYAGNSNSNIEDKFVKATSVKKVNSKDRKLYMPRIITPEELKSGFYGGLGVSASALASNTSPTILSSKEANNRMTDLTVIAGYNFNKYISAESRAMVSLSYDNDVDFKSFGLYVKPKYEVYKNVTLYSLIGLGVIDAKNIYNDKLKADKTTLQVGIGADYKLKNNFKVFADYTYLGKDSNGKYNNKPAVLKSSAITTGITYDF